MRVYKDKNGKEYQPDTKLEAMQYMLKAKYKYDDKATRTVSNTLHELHELLSVRNKRELIKRGGYVLVVVPNDAGPKQEVLDLLPGTTITEREE